MKQGSRTKRGRRRDGFTLTELVVATTISALVIVGLFSAFSQHRQTYWVQQMMNEMTQSVRSAKVTTSRDLRMAGYGVAPASGTIPQWFNWGPPVTSVIQVTQGATTNDSDQVTLISAVDPAVSTIAFGTSVGDTTLSVASGTGSEFNTTDKKVIFIGRTEMARILVVNGDSLTISTDPVSTGAGLQHAYADGDPVELVKIITYATGVNTNFSPSFLFLKRDENTADLTDDLDKIVAVNIEDFQLNKTTNSVSIQITARTPSEDSHYIHPVQGDGFRRVTLDTLVVPRNPQ